MPAGDMAVFASDLFRGSIARPELNDLRLLFEGAEWVVPHFPRLTSQTRRLNFVCAEVTTGGISPVCSKPAYL
jgi:hypothetical protein